MDSKRELAGLGPYDEVRRAMERAKLPAAGIAGLAEKLAAVGPTTEFMRSMEGKPALGIAALAGLGPNDEARRAMERAKLPVVGIAGLAEKLAAVGPTTEFMRSMEGKPAVGIAALAGLGPNDEARRAMERAKLPVVGIAGLAEKLAAVGPTTEFMRSMEGKPALGIAALGGLGLNDEARRAMERAKLPVVGIAGLAEKLAAVGPTTEFMRSMEGKPALGIAALAGLGPNDEARRAMERAKLPVVGIAGLAEKLAAVGPASEDLRRSFEQVSLRARDVEDALSRMHVTAHHEVQPIDLPDVSPNPIWETNSHLSELTDTVTQLVEVARHQAELSQAIRNASDLALQNAIQSGNEARAATELARRSVRLTFWAIIVAVIVGTLSIGLSLYENLRESATTERHRQEEIRVLRDMSGQLKDLSREAPVKPAAKYIGKRGAGQR